MRIGDRIALLKGGRLVQAGRAEELYLKPADLFVAGFFSELNVFQARVRDGAADTPVGKVDGRRPRGGRAGGCGGAHGGLRCQRDQGEIEARIVSRRYLGVVELDRTCRSRAPTCRCGRGSAAALCPPAARDIWLSLRRSDVLVFETGGENA